MSLTVEEMNPKKLTIWHKELFFNQLVDMQAEEYLENLIAMGKSHHMMSNVIVE